MKSMAMGFAVGVALLGFATSDGAAQSRDGPSLSPVVADTVTVPGVLAVFQPGGLVRTRFAECGDERRPVTELTGTFVEFQPDAFEMEVLTGDQRQLHQVQIDDILRLELGIERSLTKRGALIGALSGAALGIATVAAGGSGDWFDSGGAEYAAGTGIFGLVGAGVGALIGSRSTTVEWRKIPLFGAAYCQ